MQNNFNSYEDNAPALVKWSSGFGLKETDVNEVVSQKIVVPIQEKKTKEEVFESVQGQIEKIVGFKQAVFDVKKVKIQKKIQQEEEEQKAKEAAAAAAE